MPYEIHWQQDKRIIYGRFYDGITIPEAARWGDDVLRFLDAGDSPVHLIVNAADLKRIPANLDSIKNSARYLGDPRMGWNLVIGGLSLAQSFAQIFANVTQTPYRSFQTLDDALEFLRREDPSLSELAQH
jgi:hypothetical protein